LKQFIAYLFLLLNLIAAFALAFASLSVFLSPEKIWYAAIFGMAYPYLLLLNFIFLILWVIFKPKFAVLSLLVILAGFNHIGNYLQLRGRQTDEKGIKITSYNVKYFTGSSQYPTRENANHILNFLRQENADIICLQEVQLNKRQIFDISNSKLPLINHMQLAHTSHEGGQLTMTRFSIVNMGESRFKNSGYWLSFSDGLFESDGVRVFRWV
jgi:hypothetical protein